MSSPTTRAIAAMQQEIADLRRRVRELEHAHARRRRNSTDDAIWLSALAARFGGEVFSAVQVRDSSDPALRAALEGLTARQIAAALRRVRAHPIAPYRVQIVSREGGGRLWCLTVDVCGRQTP